MKCTQMIEVRTKGGRKTGRFEPCDGWLEASTTIYLDIDKGSVDGDTATLDDISPSHVNDEYRGVPMDLEAHFTVSCVECGYGYVPEFSDEFRKNMGLQPIGNAPRTLGRRGGTDLHNDDGS